MQKLVVALPGGTVGGITGRNKEDNDDRTAPGDRLELQPRRRFGGQNPGLRSERLAAGEFFACSTCSSSPRARTAPSNG